MLRPTSFFAALARLLPLLLILVTTAGCGGEKTHRISGKVTFKGKPVSSGKIFFSPDPSKKRSGPSGYAEIKDGSFDTASTGGKGAISGSMIVAIEGFEPVEGKSADAQGSMKSLFPRYETTLEVTGDMTKDFDVPKDPPKKTPAGGTITP